MILWSVLRAECRREFLHIQAYFLDFLADQVLFVAGFLLLTGLFQLVSQGEFTATKRLVSLTGFLTWRVADGILLHSVNGMARDARWGTLEQIWLSPVHPSLVLAVRIMAALLIYTLRAALIAAIVAPLLGIVLPVNLSLAVVFLLTQAGVAGVALGLLGLHLTYKQVASVGLALSTALLFVTGALFPLEGIPWLTGFAQILPLGLGIQLLQEIAPAPVSLVELVTFPAFHWLSVHTVVSCLIGVLLLRRGEHMARQRGQLAHY